MADYEEDDVVVLRRQLDTADKKNQDLWQMVNDLEEEIKKLKQENAKTKQQWEECHKRLFTSVVQRPEASVLPSLDTRDSTQQRTENEQLYQRNRALEQELDRSRSELNDLRGQTDLYRKDGQKMREELLSLRSKLEEVSDKEYSRESVQRMMKGRQERYDDDLRIEKEKFENEKKMLVQEHEQEINTLQTSLHSTKAHVLQQMREELNEEKEELEIELENKKATIASMSKEEKQLKEKWESERTKWILERANLDGTIRDLHAELLELKQQRPVTPPSYTPARRRYESEHLNISSRRGSNTGTASNGTSTEAEDISDGRSVYKRSVSSSSGSDNEAHHVSSQSENVLNKEYAKLQREFFLLQLKLKDALAERNKLDDRDTRPVITPRKRTPSTQNVHKMETIPALESSSLSST